jgi:hypothetical protein
LEREQHRYSLKNFAVDAGVRVLFMLTSSGQKQTRVNVVGALHDEMRARPFTLLSFGGKNPPFFLISGKQQNSTNTHPTMPVMGCISLIVLF